MAQCALKCHRSIKFMSAIWSESWPFDSGGLYVFNAHKVIVNNSKVYDCFGGQADYLLW
jgi:hypothetical protein